MRRALLLLACASATTLMMAWLIPRAPQGWPDHPRGPTAAEEGDVEGRAGGSIRTKVPAPTTVEKPRAAPPYIRRAGAPRPDLSVDLSLLPLPVNSGARVLIGKRGMRESEDRPGQSSSGEQQPVPQLAAPLAGSGRLPVFTPPVLLTPVAGYPAEGYRVALDRSALTPQLRVEAAQGRVVLRILVRADGSVGEVAVAESSGFPALDEAAIRAAAAWMFAPATKDGQPLEAWAVVPVRFIIP